jgi:hypothetical protein
VNTTDKEIQTDYTLMARDFQLLRQQLDHPETFRPFGKINIKLDHFNKFVFV